MQFVLVFIDKFIGLVKPYVHYEYFDDGVDRGYAIRECCKRILELGSDREKLREARQESSKLRQRIVGKGAGVLGFNSNFKIDEEAFYKKERAKPHPQQSGDKYKSNQGQSQSPTKPRPGQSPKKPGPPGKGQAPRELSLAEKLGLQTDKKEDTEHIKKRTKEDQKEVEEIKKILAAPGENMQAYFEFDIFEEENNPSQQNTNMSGKQADLFDLTKGTNSTPQQPQQQSQKQQQPQQQQVPFGCTDLLGNNNQGMNMGNNQGMGGMNMGNNQGMGGMNNQMDMGMNNQMNQGMNNQMNLNQGMNNQMNLNQDMGIFNNMPSNSGINYGNPNSELTDAQKKQKANEDAFAGLDSLI